MEAVLSRLKLAARGTPRAGSPAAISLLQVLPVLALMGFAVLLPLAAMAGLTFIRSGIFGLEWAPTLANWDKLAGDPLYGVLLLKSLRIALATTVIVLLVSYPVGYWLARCVRRHKMLLLLLIFVPYWVSYVVRTYAWLPLLGTNGVINQALMGLGITDAPITWLLYNEFSVMLVMVYVFLPFGIIPLYLSLERIDGNLLRASADLGASPFDTFRQVVLPLSMPGLAGATVTVFVLTIGAYVTPKLVGGPSGIMFGQTVADQFGATFNWAFGATLALTLAVVTLGFVLLVSRRVPLTRVYLQG